MDFEFEGKSRAVCGPQYSLIGETIFELSRFAGHDKMKQAATKQNLPQTAEELDRRFDEGEDVESLGFDLSKAKRPGLEIQRTTLDLPAHMLEKLDRQAALRGVPRQSLIKMWLYEKLELYK